MELAVKMRERWKARVGGDGAIGVKAGPLAEARFDPRSREMVVVANTADVDLEDEVVVPGGALPANGGSMHYFLTNRKVFWGHDYTQPAVGVIAPGTNPSLKARGWFVKVKMAATPVGDALVSMMEDGAFPASSVGFLALEQRSPTAEEMAVYGDARSIVPRWHWLELSLTDMPMNVACQASGDAPAKSIRDERWLSMLDQKVCAGQIKRKAALDLGLPEKRVIAIGAPRRIVVSA